VACGTIYRILRKTLGVENFRAYPPEPEIYTTSHCTFDMRKPTVVRRMVERGGERSVPAYAVASVAHTDNQTFGDTVVLIENTSRTAEELQKVRGCRLLDVHQYPQWGISHVHFDCRDADIVRLMEIVLEG